MAQLIVPLNVRLIAGFIVSRTVSAKTTPYTASGPRGGRQNCGERLRTYHIWWRLGQSGCGADRQANQNTDPHATPTAIRTGVPDSTLGIHRGRTRRADRRIASTAVRDASCRTTGQTALGTAVRIPRQTASGIARQTKDEGLPETICRTIPQPIPQAVRHIIPQAGVSGLHPQA
jgi:hypothetical protein